MEPSNGTYFHIPTSKLMKRIFALLLTSSTVLYSFGQYVFSTTNVPYQGLVSPIPLNNGSPWNNSSSFQVYFNFDFLIHGETITALNVMAGGGLSFPGIGNKQLRVFGHPDSGYLLEDKDQVNSSSPISYEVLGDPGQRILKVQWQNAGFREWCASSDSSDYVNFQIWLFEVDDHIEVHFGDFSADAGAYGQPDCNGGTDGTQFIFEFDNCNNALSLTGPCVLPSYAFRDHCIWQPGIHVSGTPPSGTVYALAPEGDVGVDDISASPLRLYPNPVGGILHVGDPSGNAIRSIEITDMRGRMCFAQQYGAWTDKEVLIDLGDVDNGVYSLKVMVEDGSQLVRKIIKAE